MIPCEPCSCGGRRLVYRKLAPPGARFITRYRRCADCGDVSKTIQRSDSDDFSTLFERTHQIGLDLVTGDSATVNCELRSMHGQSITEVSKHEN